MVDREKQLAALGEAMQRWPGLARAVAANHSSLASCGAIDMRRYSGGWVEVPAGLASTTLTWYHARTENGTYVPVYFGGAIVTTTLPGSTACVVEIPEACWDKHWLKCQPDADTNTVYVGFKT